MVHGFIYDEEATVYLRYAWDAGIWRALVAPHQGYYAFFPNVCGIIAARVVPLMQAARFCFWAEIAVQMLLVYMVVQCERFESYWTKALAVAIALLSPPTETIATSTIHGQFFLAAMTGIILVSDAERLRRARLLALLFAGLTGVTSCVLMPFFLVQARKERSPARIAQARVLIACTLVQVMVLYFQPWILHGPHSTFGFYSGALLAFGVLGHFFTYAAHAKACAAIGSTKLEHWRDLWWAGVSAGAIVYAGFILFLSARAGRSAKLLVGAAFLSLAVSFKRSGAIDSDLMCGSGGRYFFIFNVLVGFALLLVRSKKLGWKSQVAAVMIAACVVSGAMDVRVRWRRPHVPDWQEQVAHWRTDHRHPIELRPGWPGLKLAAVPRQEGLPPDIYDSTEPGWQDR